MYVRDRRQRGEGALLEIAKVVHERDGYPPYLPRGDFRDLLFGDETLGAWVPEDEHSILGQVALHRESSAPVMELAARTIGEPFDRLGVIARLFVDPRRRGAGTGTGLLDRAAREAVRRDLWPVLDVATDLIAAVQFYERRGWVRAGEVAVTFPGGITIDEYVYLAPPEARPAAT